MSDDLNFEMEVVKDRRSDRQMQDSSEGRASGSSVSHEVEDLPEIERIPPGWELSTVGGIAQSTVGGGTPSKSNEDYWGGEIPWASVKDLDGTTVGDTEDFITEEGVENSATNLIPSGSVIISTRMTVGEAFMNLVGMAINQDLKAIRPDQSQVNTHFLTYALREKDRYLKSLGRGTTVSGITTADLERTHLALPSLLEQRKIASVLYTVDQAIQTTEEIIEQAKRVKQGLTQVLFRKGLHSEASDYEEVRFGPVLTQIPTHWNRARIGDVYSEHKLGTTERGATEGEEHIPLIKMGNLGFGTWDFSEVERVDRDKKLIEEYHIEKGDLLFNTRNTPDLVGKTAIWDAEETAVYDNNLLRLRFGDEIESGYFANYYLSSSIGRRQLRARVHGTTSVAAIYWSDLQQVEIPVPPRDEQKEIIRVLRRIDRAINNNRDNRRGLQSIKKGLMQDLLTGEVRTADKAVEILDEVKAHG